MERCHPQPTARDHPIILARFVGMRSPAHVAWCAEIRGTPFKKTAKTGIGYLEKAEMDALLAQPDRRTPLGDRDHALLLFLYNSGARADETAGLTIDSLELGAQSSVRLHGKGNKFRTCPLWSVTATSLSPLVVNRGKSDSVFLNRSNQPLTRFGIHRLVTRYAERASRTVPSMATKRVSPHTIGSERDSREAWILDDDLCWVHGPTLSSAVNNARACRRATLDRAHVNTGWTRRHGWRAWRHELSHRGFGRGDGRGGRESASIMRPPQQGQISRRLPVSSA